MLHSYKTPAILVSLLSLLLACYLSSQQPSAPREIWIDRWLNAPVCLPPCWENIVVGKSTGTEVRLALEQLSDINNLTALVPDGKIYTVSWTFTSTQSSGLIIIDQLSVAKLIMLKIDDRQILSLEDVFAVYGNPSSIFVYGNGEDVNNYGVQLVYIDSGFLLELYLPQKDNMVNILSSSKIFGVMFFLPGIDGFSDSFTTANITEPSRLDNWRGFGDYPKSP